MDLTVQDLARLFGVSEKTILRWIKERGLPSHKVHDQSRFSRPLLLEWARKENVAISPDVSLDDAQTQDVSFAQAVAQGGIHYRVPGNTKEQALRAIAALVKLPSGFSAEELGTLLLARETLASTGTGQGIAIPHVRNPIVLPIEAASVAICFLDRPIDFGAVDGKPVHTFFLLLAPTIRDHLKLLSKIAFLLHDAGFLDMLARREKSEQLLARIKTLEESLSKKSKQ